METNIIDHDELILENIPLEDVPIRVSKDEAHSDDSTVLSNNNARMATQRTSNPAQTTNQETKLKSIIKIDKGGILPLEQNPIEPSSPLPSKHHRKIVSDVSLPSLGGSSHRKPRSIIGSVYRRSHSGHRIRLSSDRHLVTPTDILVGDEDLEGVDTSWGEVCRACCCHTASEWLHISIFLWSLLLLLYFFLAGLDLLGTSFQVVGGCKAGSLLASDTNPMASVMIGIIATTLLQSSSTTSAIIVSLVSGGLDVQQGIYMIMGANVGTSVTALLVSLAHMGDGDELERAFSGSSVLFVFNFFTVIILLPLEITTNYLFKLTELMLPATVGGGDSWEGPIKKIVSPLVKTIIIANKDLIDQISTGNIASCSEVYPVECIGFVESYETCVTGVIGCNSKNGKCPMFFQAGAEKRDDMVSGWVCLIVAVTILIFCLIGLVTLLRKILLGASTQIIYKATNINPYLAMLIGCGVTILVQSSSITSAALVPLAGIGVLDVEHMFPLVLGADIGTCVTALMAALVSSKVQALQIALCHLFFNLTGGVIWYPIPFMRRIVLGSCRLIGKATRFWRGFPIVFILSMFFLLPLLLLGISTCFEKQTNGFTALGIFILVIIFGIIAYFLLWWYYRDGKTKCRACIQRRQRRAAATQALADDMDYLKVDTEWCKNEIGRIKDFASHIEATASMEEGRPIVTILVPPAEEEETIATEEDDRLSTFESCRSRPWKDILIMGAGSIKSELQ